MNNFKIFKKLYIDHMLTGERVDKKTLSYTYDKEFIDEAIDKLFVECPTKFPSEYKSEKHYLLKRKWHILNQLHLTYSICKHNPLKSFIYIYWFIVDLFHINSTWNYYMHPTQLNRL